MILKDLEGEEVEVGRIKPQTDGCPLSFVSVCTKCADPRRHEVIHMWCALLFPKFLFQLPNIHGKDFTLLPNPSGEIYLKIVILQETVFTI